MRRIITVISAVLLIGVLWIWIRSFTTSDDIGFAYADGSQIEAYTLSGRIHYVVDEAPMNSRPGWYQKSTPQWSGSGDLLGHDRGFRFAGFVFVHDPYVSDYHSFHALIPIWFLALVASLMPIAGLLSLIRARLPARATKVQDGPADRASAGGRRILQESLRRARTPRGAIAALLILILAGTCVVDWRIVAKRSAPAIWTLVDDPPPVPPEKMKGLVVCVVCTHDGKILAYGGDDNNAHLMDVTTGKSADVLRGHRGFVSCIAFNSAETTLASGSDDGTIRLWDVASHRLDGILKDNTSGVRSIAFSDDGSMLISGSSHMLRIWDVAAQKVLRSFPADYDDESVQFTPDGQSIISSGGTLKIWDSGTGEVRLEFGGNNGISSIPCVARSRDGLLALGGFDNNIQLWNTAPPTLLATLKGHTDAIYSLAFSPDGKFLASGSPDRSIRIWDVGSHQSIAKLTGRHNKGICFLHFCTDGKTLISASYDGIVERWELK
ncbi:MAG TPA: WD40 repeat domain-containing protein [Tepidisphaeraceae bacterium]|jgi:hypothetical protein|nr:WD40 repeat domain-containing protein [Tepidisphaeraceae bacterium]